MTFRLGRPAAITIAAWLFSTLVTATFPASASAQPDKVDVLIGFREHPCAADEAFVMSCGGDIKCCFNVVPAMAASVPRRAMRALRRNPNIVLVEPDGFVHALEQSTPWGVSKIGADVVQSTVSGAGILVAVIDTGVDLDHPDLASNLYLNPLELAGQPGVDDDGNGYIDDIQGWDFVNDDNVPDDDNGHGTHCAGTIGAINNTIGVLGVAPNVRIVPIKVLSASGGGSFSDVIAAIDYCAANGIHITSNSYGIGGNPGVIVQAAFDNANAVGVLNIAAAGNSGNSSGTGESVGYPASFDSVVAVGATTSGDNRASFSSTGVAVELAAPGSGIRSTVPGGYATFSGTSMACPHVAGAAALLMEAGEVLRDGGNGNRLTNFETRQLLADSAVDLGDSGRDTHFGFGRIDVVAALDALPGDSGGDGGDGDDGGDDNERLTEVHVTEFKYKVRGKRRPRLIVRVTVVDVITGEPAVGVDVSADFLLNGSPYSSSTSTTNSRGRARFRVRRPPTGSWNTVITDISGDGFTWDGSQDLPDNGYQF